MFNFLKKKKPKSKWAEKGFVEVPGGAVGFTMKHRETNPVFIHGETQVIHVGCFDVENANEQQMRYYASMVFNNIKHCSRAVKILVGEYASGALWDILYMFSEEDGEFNYAGHRWYRQTSTTRDGSGEINFTSFKRIA